jgi:hypothetical protein
MATLTNTLDLPQSIANAVAYPSYSSGGSDITVTQLIKPPQMVLLEKENRKRVVEDVSDRIWALFGSATHYILEKAVGDGDIAEQRVFMTINDWKVSGQFDLITQNLALQDFKTTSVWSVMDAIKNGKSEWGQQLNLLAALVRQDAVLPNPSRLQIVAICRDWRNAESLRNPDYPRKVEIIDIPLWESRKAEAFLIDQVRLHQDAQLKGIVPACTDEERWYRGEKWAVMKKGRKSALRLLDTKEQANIWALENKLFLEEADTLKNGITIEHRAGTYGRCEQYCNAAPFCSQFQGEK